MEEEIYRIQLLIDRFGFDEAIIKICSYDFGGIL